MSTNHLLPLSSKWETNFTPLKMWVVYYIQWLTFDKQNWWNWLCLTSRTSPRTCHFCLALSWILLFREAGGHVGSTLEQPVKRRGTELSSGASTTCQPPTRERILAREFLSPSQPRVDCALGWCVDYNLGENQVGTS